ncbi:asparaginase [Amanita muscaria]
MNPTVFVAVHGGAGNHTRKSKDDIKRGLRQACIQALSKSQENNVLAIIENAISALEDDPHFNSGYGSNLTIDGNVECDASIMDETGDYGSVAAISGIKNPICLARQVLEHAKTPDGLGRLPPMFLVSEGARTFAAIHAHSIQFIQPDELKAPRAVDEWRLWKERFTSLAKHDGKHDDQLTGMNDIQDTVGAVALVEGGYAAAGVSSGGLLLKNPGRVGEAAVYGAGCWAQTGMACSVSGAGEHIVRTNLARSIGEAFARSEDVDPHDVLYRTLIDKFWSMHNPCRARGEPSPNAGLILLTKSDECNSVRLWCAFTTPSMAIAYTSTVNPVPKAIILRRPPEIDKQSNDQPRIFITAVTL